MDSLSKVSTGGTVDKPVIPIVVPTQPVPTQPTPTQPTPVTPQPTAPTQTPVVPVQPTTPAPTQTVPDITAPVVPAANPPGNDEDSYEKMFPEPTVAIEGPPQWVWWFLLVVGSAVLGLVGFRVVNGGYGNGVVATSSSPTPTPTASAQASTSPSPTLSSSPTPSTTPTSSISATPTPKATSTPTPTTSKSTITMRVLNGTTTSGLAAQVRTTLQSAGFTVQSIGNANNQTYTSTVIYYATGQLAGAQSVQQALSSYSPTLQESSSLASPDDVLVVVGPH